MQQGQPEPAPTQGVAGYWGRDLKNKRVWIGDTNGCGQPATIQAYVDAEQAKLFSARQMDKEHSQEWRKKRPFVLCFKNFAPRSESSMTARSAASLASSIAFSNNPWEANPRIGGSHVYTKVGSRVFKASSFEPADSYYERTRPPNIPNTSTNMGVCVNDCYMCLCVFSLFCTLMMPVCLAM